MRVMFPSDTQTRPAVVAAIGAGKTVAWLFGDSLLVYTGTSQKIAAKGKTAATIPLNGYADFFVQGGTTGFSAAVGVNSTDAADDAQAAAQVAALP